MVQTKVIVKKWVFYVVCFMIYGCTTEPKVEVPKAVKSLENVTVHAPDVEPSREITLEKEVTYKDTEEVTRGRIGGNIVVDSRGRVYIPDFQAKVVHVYNADGSYLDSIGREGQGPGEFQMIWTIRIAYNKLYVLDYIHQKISVFDLKTQRHLHDFSLSLNRDGVQAPAWLEDTHRNNLLYKPINFYVRPDSTYLIFFGDEDIGSADNVNGRTYEISIYDPMDKEYLKHDFLSFKWTGNTLVDEHNEGMTVLPNVLYKRSSRFTYSGKELIHGWTEEMLFKTYDEEGQY